MIEKILLFLKNADTSYDEFGDVVIRKYQEIRQFAEDLSEFLED